ncbi:hypothetical protein [Streptomyces sp. R35]|uniref:Uncharacterized protein n=1 Tax=Streptomyces sp. R35 TaxID=3238630 RepID=A0AB39SRH6_9ACTN
MTSLSTPRPSDRWLLQVTIQSARADEVGWNEQRTVLRSVSSYDPVTQTWSTLIGVLDLASVHKLQALFDVVRTFGSAVWLEPVPVPAWWQEPSFESDSEVAALLAVKADEGRPLGQLPVA